MDLLKVDKLSVHFGGVQAVKEVSFSVPEGERLAIIGPNGAGKTTLFNLLTGQLKPTSGKVYFKGQDITHMPVFARTHLGMSRSFQIASLFPHETVINNTLIGIQGTRPNRYGLFSAITGDKKLFAQAEQVLKSMDLWEKREEKVDSISYGEQRKLEIALSLASNPLLLLLDEPSCGLTITESADIKTRVRNLGEKLTLVMIAHDMDLVFGVAQRIILLHYGEILTQGTPEEIRVNPKVKEIYMGKIKI